MDSNKFWEKQYQRNISSIIATCYRYVGDDSVAEDLAHDVFIKAMDKSHTIRSIFNFDNWLKRIAVNHCLDYLRQQPNFVPLPSDLEEEIPEIDDSLVWKAELSKDELLNTIHQLPELHRAVFNLYAIEGYSHRRIADLLGITVPYSKQLLCRARAKLRKMLADKHIENEKLKKGLLMTIWIPFLKKAFPASRRIDRLYRSQLSALRLAPTHPMAASEISKAATAMPGKIGTVLAAHKTALLLVTATGVTGGTIAWQADSNTSPATDPENTPSSMVSYFDESQRDVEDSTIADSTFYPQNKASLPTQETANSAYPKTADNNEPVIVTQKVLVQKNVDIHDTTTIADTVFMLRAPRTRNNAVNEPQLAETKQVQQTITFLENNVLNGKQENFTNMDSLKNIGLAAMLALTMNVGASAQSDNINMQKSNEATPAYKHSVGLSLGMFNGLSMKNYLADHVYFQTDVGLSYIGLPFSLIMTSTPLIGYSDLGVRLGVMYEKQFQKHPANFWFVGGGIDFGKDLVDDPEVFSSIWPMKIGIHGIAGFEWTFKIPLSLQLDIRPGYGILLVSNNFMTSNDWFVITKFPCHFFDFTVAFSIRYRFGKTNAVGVK